MRLKPIQGKTLTAFILGSLVLLTTSLWMLGSIRTLFVHQPKSIWQYLDYFAIWLLVGYFGIVGLQAVKFALDGSVVFGRIIWWRVAVGTFVIERALRTHFAPTPDMLKAKNASQAAGMNFAFLIMVLCGFCLLVSAFNNRTATPLQSKDEPLVKAQNEPS
jgi:hypothetical protein